MAMDSRPAHVHGNCRYRNCRGDSMGLLQSTFDALSSAAVPRRVFEGAATERPADRLCAALRKTSRLLHPRERADSAADLDRVLRQWLAGPRLDGTAARLSVER